jgi:hypothetical protein
MIDWTKPVETDENPPRLVRVLATDLPLPYSVAIAIDNGHGTKLCQIRADGSDPYSHVRLRNVPSQSEANGSTDA